MKDIEIDHRPSWHSLQGVRGLATQVVLFLVGRIIGRIRNTLDSIQSTRQFVTYLMHTERSYFGFATHPQRVPLFTLLPRISVQGLAPLGGKRFWRWATRSVIMGEKPGPRQPLPTPSWLRRQWVQFHGSESAPTGSGDWQTMPSQGFLKRWAERKGRG